MSLFSQHIAEIIFSVEGITANCLSLRPNTPLTLKRNIKYNNQLILMNWHHSTGKTI